MEEDFRSILSDAITATASESIGSRIDAAEQLSVANPRFDVFVKRILTNQKLNETLLSSYEWCADEIKRQKFFTWEILRYFNWALSREFSATCDSRDARCALDSWDIIVAYSQLDTHFWTFDAPLSNFALEEAFGHQAGINEWLSIARRSDSDMAKEESTWPRRFSFRAIMPAQKRYHYAPSAAEGYFDDLLLSLRLLKSPYVWTTEIFCTFGPFVGTGRLIMDSLSCDRLPRHSDVP